LSAPPDLVAAFAARLDRVLKHLRGELRPGDVLVYRAAFWSSKSDLAPPVPSGARLTVGRGPEAAPLTVADALEVVTASRDLLAAAFAEELGLAVGALVPEVHQTWALEDPAVLAAWPVRVAGFPGLDGTGRSAPPPGPVEALSHLLERVPNLPGELAPELNTLPAVASWARGAPLVDAAGRYLGSFPSCGLNALYRHLRARSPLFAAVEAGRLVRELVSDEGSRLWLAAVDAALTAGEPDALADFARADVARRGAYAGALVAAARTVADRVFTAPAPVDDDAARETTGSPPALLWDRRFAAELDRWGGERAPDVLALAVARACTSGADLWHLWAPVDGPPRWLRALARELWLSLWKPALARERRPVALSRFAIERIGGVLLGRDVVPGSGGRDVLVDGTGQAIAPFELPRLATLVDADALELLARPGVQALTTIAAARFVPWFAEQVQRRPDEHAPIVFEGTDGVNAWGTVAAALGMDAGKHAGEVRGMLHALQATIIQYPNGDEAGVLHVDYRAGGGRGNPSRLTVRPGRPWLSSDVHTLPDSAEYRALAPIPALEGYAPPFVGDRRERAALARLWLCLLVELTRGSPDLSRGLGAHIPGARWAELANMVGVLRPRPLLVSLLQDRWAVDGDDGAAVLERVGPDRWHLAPRFEAERTMLENGGRMRLGAAEGGRRSARARTEERERLAAGLPRSPKGRKG
jgi:hypothetical protein